MKLFSENGADIFACSRNLTDEFDNFINQTQKEFNNKIIPIEMNLENENSVKEASKKILSENNRYRYFDKQCRLQFKPHYFK